MLQMLANAEPNDSTTSSLTLIIICVGIVVLVAAAAFVLVGVAWSRRSRYSDAIVLGAVVWWVLASASLISTTMTQMKWSREKDLRIQSGYYDPNDAASDQPQIPWASWGGLAGLYLVLVTGSMVGPRSDPRDAARKRARSTDD